MCTVCVYRQYIMNMYTLYMYIPLELMYTINVTCECTLAVMVTTLHVHCNIVLFGAHLQISNNGNMYIVM